MNIVDAHIHVWSSDFDRYPLAPGFTPADLWLPSFTPDDHFAYSHKVGKVRINLVQMTWYGLDHSYILDLIASDPETYTGTGIVPGVSDVSAGRPGQDHARLGRGGASALSACAAACTGRPTAFGRSDRWLDYPGYESMFRTGAEHNLASQLPHGTRRPARPDPPLPPLPRNPRNPRPHLRSAHPRRRLARRRYSHPLQHGPLPARHGQARPVPKPSANGEAPTSTFWPLIERIVDAFGPERVIVGKRQRRPRPHEKSRCRLCRGDCPNPRPRRFPQPKRQGIHSR